MRLIGQITGGRLAKEFSYYLSKEGIENTFEPHGSGDDYAIWVTDEDDVEAATTHLRDFIARPENPKFHGHYREAKKIEDAKLQAKRIVEVADEKVTRSASGHRFGVITILLIVLSTACFLWGGMSMITEKGDGATPLIITRPIYAGLLYDFPQVFEMFNTLASQYPREALEDPSTLPPAGQELLQEALHTPYWTGLYFLFLQEIHAPVPDWSYDGPLFEKISQGEVWRLFTPALLHADIFHIVFNVIWILILGTQVETRIGWFKYLVLVLIAGVATNTGQYLMSGPLFMGLSGIVCGLFGFIWMRQKLAPWEGYHLHRVTIAFILIFILAMLALQLVSFGLEVSGKAAIAPPIANTAHIVGAIVGILLGRFEFFAFHRARAL